MLGFYSGCTYPLSCFTPSFDGAIAYDIHSCQTTPALLISDKMGEMYKCLQRAILPMNVQSWLPRSEQGVGCQGRGEEARRPLCCWSAQGQ